MSSLLVIRLVVETGLLAHHFSSFFFSASFERVILVVAFCPFNVFTLFLRFDIDARYIGL